MILRLLAVGSFVILVSFAVVHAQTPQEVARKAFATVVLLVMENASGQPVSVGSGFFVREGVIASNLHVVESASRGYAKLIGQKAKFDIEGSVGVDPVHDLILLKVSGGPTTPLTLGNSETVQIGETVYAVGNPQGLEGTFSQGIISGMREVGTERLLQITAPISPGSSGGPVVNSRGEVIGVAVATFKGGQNLNFAIPSGYLKTLVANLQPLTPLTKAKPVAKQRSILADFGGRSVEGVVGGQLTWDHEHSQIGYYAFSLRNQLREAIRNVYCLVVFHDSTGTPIDTDAVKYRGIIPPGLAKRVTSNVDGSVQKLTTPYGSRTPKTRVEFRVLDFQIVE